MLTFKQPVTKQFYINYPSVFIKKKSNKQIILTAEAIMEMSQFIFLLSLLERHLSWLCNILKSKRI